MQIQQPPVNLNVDKDSKPVVVKEEVEKSKNEKACSYLNPADVRMSSESK